MSQFEEDGFSLWLEEEMRDVEEKQRRRHAAEEAEYARYYNRWQNRLSRWLSERLFTLSQNLQGPPPPEERDW